MSGENGDLIAAIAALRADLQGAMNEGLGQDMQFGLGDVELTLRLVATKHGGGKIGWSVFGVDAGAANERTHTLRLTLQPRYRASDGTYTADFTVVSRTAGESGVGVKRT
jgi:hypothetical protein